MLKQSGYALVAVMLLVASTFAQEPTEKHAGDTSRVASTTWESFTEPFRQVELAAAETGRVSRVLVERGALVTEGELLIELDLEILEAQRQIAAHRANSRARVESAKVEAEKFAGRYRTLQTLRTEGAGTAEELRDAETEAQVAMFKVSALEEDLQQYALEVKEIEQRIEQRRVRSPFAGIVTEVHRQPGESVSTVEPLVVTLVDLSKLRTTFFLPTSHASRLSEGGQLSIHILDDRQTVATGFIEHISAVTRADSGRVRVDVIIDNTSQKYRSGLRCTLDPASRSSATRSTPDLGGVR